MQVHLMPTLRGGCLIGMLVRIVYPIDAMTRDVEAFADHGH